VCNQPRVSSGVERIPSVGMPRVWHRRPPGARRRRQPTGSSGSARTGDGSCWTRQCA
jgi:hypothetical protein